MSRYALSLWLLLILPISLIPVSLASSSSSSFASSFSKRQRHTTKMEATATASSATTATAAAAAIDHRNRLYSALVAGVGSGALASIICAPIDLIRTRLQVWNSLDRRPVQALPQMLADIIRRDGLQGCFRGLSATLVTVPAFWGVYWPIYDEAKRRWSATYPHVNSMWIHMTAAITAGVVSDVICNPMFVVRTRLQTEALHNPSQQHLSMRQTALALYHEGGLRIFWRGMTANLLGLSHVAVQFPVYEKLKHWFRAHKRHESALDLLLASGLSKMSACILTYPHEVIRSRMMDARTRVSFVQTCQRIHAAEGMAGFYSGLPITLIRVIPNTCITFVTYELFLRWAREQLELRKR